MRIRSSVVVLIVVFVTLGAGTAYVVGTRPVGEDARASWQPPDTAEGIAAAPMPTDPTGGDGAMLVAEPDETGVARSEIEDQPDVTEPTVQGEAQPTPDSVSPSGGTTVPAPRPQTADDFAQGLPDGRRIYGVITRGGDDDELEEFIEVAQRRPNLIGVTAGWAEHEYTPWYTERLALMGAMPMISWEPWDASKESTVEQLRSEQPDFALSRILSGEFDDYIDNWAEGLADWGRPVMLRFAHEMNGSWYPWADNRNGNEPGAYAATWRYIHDRFTAAEADNVIWVWSPNVSYARSTPLTGLYPGDDYVDWVGVVGYFGHFAAAPSSQPGFEGIFGPTLEQLAAITDKPVLITETGSGPYGALKADWITDAVDAFANDPRVEGFVWFNVDKEYDWRINSSPEALAAFREAISDPAFVQGSSPTGS